ncbi:MAG: transglutaminase domain-containing protein [Isosphaeraceae bacterium]
MALEVPLGRLARLATLALAGLATAAVELAIAEPERSQLAALAGASVFLMPVLAVAWYRARWVVTETHVERSAMSAQNQGETGGVGAFWVVLLLLVFIAPFLSDIVRIARFGRGQMLEILLLSTVRNLGLGLAALSDRAHFARLGALTSLFLVSVSSAMVEGALMIVVVSLYAAAGCVWLMLFYWERLRLPGSADSRPSLPIGSVGFLLVVLATVLFMAAIGPSRAATLLAGLMPTSGGTWWDDPEARGGVNDGDNEVAASEKPESVGFTESELYMETDRPSLYDAYNERYGEPFKPKKQERMIALAQKDINKQHERPAENLQAGRQFPLTRKRPAQPGARPGERKARSLLFVKGPTPLHLPLAAYDEFDGVAWARQPANGSSSFLELEPGTAWFRVAATRPRIFAGTVAHQIKVGSLDSSALPVPSHLARFRVGSVNRPDFFCWAQPGILAMDNRTVPAGTVIVTEALTVDPARLTQSEPTELIPSHPYRYSNPDGQYRVSPAVVALASSWTAGAARGYGQIAAVVASLRRDFTLDNSALVPADCRDAVAYFLLNSRRGDDYLFATSAAVVLRTLGYSTRVVSGFYVSPAKYDARTHHTHVDREDVHFWAEVRFSGSWVAIEPTPGYRLMGPSHSWLERIAGLIGATWLWLVGHPLPVALLAAAGCGAIQIRGRLLDWVTTLVWLLSRRRTSRRWILQTLRLIDHRARWAGRPRPPQSTPQRWYGALAATEPAETRRELERLVRLADWALYCPGPSAAPTSWSSRDIESTCWRAVRIWTLSRFQSVARSA